MNIKTSHFCLDDAKRAVGLSGNFDTLAAGWHSDGIRAVVEAGAVGCGTTFYIVAADADGNVSADLAPWSDAPRLSDCQCGCEGNYTDHSMRAGESGRPTSVIVR